MIMIKKIKRDNKINKENKWKDNQRKLKKRNYL